MFIFQSRHQMAAGSSSKRHHNKVGRTAQLKTFNPVQSRHPLSLRSTQLPGWSQQTGPTLRATVSPTQGDFIPRRPSPPKDNDKTGNLPQCHWSEPLSRNRYGRGGHFNCSRGRRPERKGRRSKAAGHSTRPWSPAAPARAGPETQKFHVCEHRLPPPNKLVQISRKHPPSGGQTQNRCGPGATRVRCKEQRGPFRPGV